LVGAGGTAAPEGHLGLVDDEAGTVGRDETGCGSHHAVHVGRGTAVPADQVVVIVADPGLDE
jgi:hypothetical protein